MRNKGMTEIEGEAALYALGALPAADAARFRTRLESGCPVCRGAYAECEEVVGLLPLAAPEADPPPSLRARLLDSIAGGRRPPEGLLVRAGDGEWADAPTEGVQYRQLRGSQTMLV